MALLDDTLQKNFMVEISDMTKAIRILPKFLQPRTNATQTYIPLCNRTHAHRN